jgi:hypothetical protein
MMHLPHYIRLAHEANGALSDAWTKLADGHSDEIDVRILCQQFSAASNDHAQQLAGFIPTVGDRVEPTEEFVTWSFRGPRSGGLGLVRDLHEMLLLTTECDLMWTLLEVGAQGVRDGDLLKLAESGLSQTKRELDWLRSRLKQAAPQALVVAD